MSSSFNQKIAKDLLSGVKSLVWFLTLFDLGGGGGGAFDARAKFE